MMCVMNTERLHICEAEEKDIPEVIALEEDKDNRDYLWVGTYEEHMDEIADPNHMLLVFREKSDKRIIGYALIRLNYQSDIFELRRIAINEKHQGYGKEAMNELLRYAFEQLNINRFWLDVYPDNEIGIILYESLGMHRDGVLRENYKADRGYLDQIIYSMLRKEYFKE